MAEQVGLEGMSSEEVEALALTAKALRDNPKTRTGFLRLAKAANPNLSVPELDLEARAAHVIGQQNQKIDKLEAQNQEREARQAVHDLYDTLRDDRIVKNKADFSSLVKYAAENGFQTSEAGLRMASQHREQAQQSAEPTPSFLSNGLPVALDKTIMKNPVGWARKEAALAIGELGKQKR